LTLKGNVLDAENAKPTLPELVSVPEAAEILGVSPQPMEADEPPDDGPAGVTGAPAVTEVARQLTLCHGTVESTAVAGRPADALW
jgi:hypothetical protein